MYQVITSSLSEDLSQITIYYEAPGNQRLTGRVPAAKFADWLTAERRLWHVPKGPVKFIKLTFHEYWHTVGDYVKNRDLTDFVEYEILSSAWLARVADLSDIFQPYKD